MTAGPTANADMADYWDGHRGAAWVSRADQFDAQLEIYALRAVSAAAPLPGESIIDIGCGAGATSFDAAQGVGTTGHVLGIDISRAMLALAAERARAEGYTNVEFVHGDAQTMDPPDRSADAIISRFGVMFFDDPVAAFANIARMTHDGGRLAFVCWGPLEHNEWMWAPNVAVSELVALTPPEDPHAPGPFAFADTGRVGEILGAAGWDDVTFEDITDSIYIAGPGTVEAAVDFVVGASALAAPLVEAGPEVTSSAREILVETFTPQHDGIGVRYPALARVVHAVRAD